MDTGALPDGSQPLFLGFVRILVEEVIKEIQLNSKIMVEIPAGVTTGMAGPVPVIAAVPIQGSGIIL